MYFHTRLLTQCSLPAHRKLSPPCFSASGPSVLSAMEDNTDSSAVRQVIQQDEHEYNDCERATFMVKKKTVSE